MDQNYIATYNGMMINPAQRQPVYSNSGFQRSGKQAECGHPHHHPIENTFQQSGDRRPTAQYLKDSQHHPGYQISQTQPLSPKFLRDPLLIAQETNQTLTALSSMRTLSPLQFQELLASNQLGSVRPSPKSHASYPRNGVSGNGGGRDGVAVAPGVDGKMTPDSATAAIAVRSHVCNFCGKKFNRPSALKIHLSTHTGEKPFVCPEDGCRRSFSVRSNMSRHVRIVHQMHREDIESDDENAETIMQE